MGRQRKRLDLARFDDRSERLDVFCVPIMQEIATIPQDAASVHGHVPGNLLYPRLVRVNGDPSDIHPAALKMDEKQQVVGHQPAQRQHLRREKVGPRNSARWIRMKVGHVVVRLRSGAGGSA